MFIVSSCSEDLEMTKIGNVENVNPPSIIAPTSGSSIILEKDNSDEVALTIEWSEPDYGVNLSAKFNVDVDYKNGDFSNSVLLTTTSKSIAELTHGELNEKLLAMGLKPEVESEVDLRIQSVVNYQIDDKFSSVVTVKATPYSTVFPSIYMIGAAVGGWDPSKAVEIASTGEVDQYETIAYFDTAEGANFRFFTAPDWGSSLGGYDVLTNYPTDYLQPATSDSDPNFNFVGTVGWYTINVNTKTGIIDMNPTNEPFLYLTGSATHGWSWDNPTKLDWKGHYIWEGDVTFAQNEYFRCFEQADWGPIGYGYDVLTNYDQSFIVIAEGHSDPNWQFVAATGSYHVLVNKREESIIITPN